MTSLDFVIVGGKTLVILLSIMHVPPFMLWFERKVAALIQDRPGPNRVGPFGIFQPIADFIKFLFKADPIPKNVNRILYVAAPFLALLPAALVIAALPFADRMILFGKEVRVQIADIHVGLLYMLAISSLGIYGILFAGWASNNKYSLMGSIRASSQMISYELPLALSVVGAVMVYGTFSLRDMVHMQEGVLFHILPRWGVFYQPLGFILFLVGAFAETNRLPFDLPESEAELVAGYHTEYGSMKFATFFLAEYMNLTTVSSLIVVIFFGGWHVPYVSDENLLTLIGSVNLLALIQIMVFGLKVFLFLFLFVWVRWTLPRFRFDQLMRLAWMNLIPLGIVNIVITAGVLYVLGGKP